jgi:hypothetical protein
MFCFIRWVILIFAFVDGSLLWADSALTEKSDVMASNVGESRHAEIAVKKNEAVRTKSLEAGKPEKRLTTLWSYQR